MMIRAFELGERGDRRCKSCIGSVSVLTDSWSTSIILYGSVAMAKMQR